MFDKLHFDVCEIIADNQNIKSLSSLITTCKKAALHQNLMNKKIDNLVASYIHGIVEVIRNFDSKCTQVWKERFALRTMVDLINKVDDNDDSPMALLYMLEKIKSQYIDYEDSYIIDVWIDACLRYTKQTNDTVQLEYTDTEKNIIQATVNCLFDETNKYSLCFQAKEQYRIQLVFNMSEKSTISFYCQDTVNTIKDTSMYKAYFDELGIKIDDFGYVDVPMNYDGYATISSVTNHVWGNKVFTNHLSSRPFLYMPCGGMNGHISETLQDYVNEYINSYGMEDKLRSVCDYRLYV